MSRVVPLERLGISATAPGQMRRGPAARRSLQTTVRLCEFGATKGIQRRFIADRF
jgi:hypothetical protein